MPIRRNLFALLPLTFAALIAAQSAKHVEMSTVENHALTRTVPLTAELAAYLQTDIEARVPGYVDRVLVDRGSVVRRGQLLVQLSAPELRSQTEAAETAMHEAEADVSQAAAQAASSASTYARLAEAAKTPGAVAGNELLQAEKQGAAAAAFLQSRQAALRTAASRLATSRSFQSYLNVSAPFDGIITDRIVHPGMRVDAGGHQPLLKLQQVSRLRLVVPIPEMYVGSVASGRSVSFHVPSEAGKTFTGTIKRIPHALEAQSRSMMVELDVQNSAGTLAPGMYPTVEWPISTGGELMFVPISSVVTTTQRTFVITSENGRARWVDVRKGLTFGERVSIQGTIHAGEHVVKRATDEIRPGQLL